MSDGDRPKTNWNDYRVDRLWDAIFGNGKEGLNVRVSRLEDARLSSKEQWALYTALFFAVANSIPTVIALVSWLGKP